MALIATAGAAVSARSASCSISASHRRTAASMIAMGSITVALVMLAVPMSFTIRRAWRALTPKRRSIDAHDSPPQRAATTLALRWARSCGLSLRVPLPRSIIGPRLGQKMTTSPIESGDGPHGQELLGRAGGRARADTPRRFATKGGDAL